MKGKITKRDVLFFFIGFMTLFFINMIWGWDNNMKAFREGMKDAQETSGIENKN